MPHLNRRQLLGLAAAGAATWTLRADAQPTPPSGNLSEYQQFLDSEGVPKISPGPFAPTEPNILGPYHRESAPFRGKITPPLADGDVMVISGRVWAFDTRKPLPNTVLDIWQADAQGRYDNDDPANPPAPHVFRCRARIVTDQSGYYEYETIHPGAYKVGPNTSRPPHIHYMARHDRYQRLVTQLYFAGDDHLETDAFVRDALIIEPRTVTTPNGDYRHGVFDIVLTPA
ncbi:MAG: hypothetical protein WD294_11660 [Phycisphaeraceae bacterium]